MNKAYTNLVAAIINRPVGIFIDRNWINELYHLFSDK